MKSKKQSGKWWKSSIFSLRFCSNDPEVQFYTENGQQVQILDVAVNEILYADGKMNVIARICCTQSGEKSFEVDVCFVFNFLFEILLLLQLTAIMGSTDPCQFNKHYSVILNVFEPFKHQLKAINNEVRKFVLEVIFCIS